MKKIILIVIAALLTLSNAYAVVKCERSPSGGVCCWDVDAEGPWRPITC